MLQRLGPYRIERLLGRGGMGSVYAATHLETGEPAAIKALSLTLADDHNFRARFMAEIETLKQLRHPNIVQIIGDGEQDGQLYFVMELVDGQSLQELLQAGHLFDWLEVTRIAIEVCAALKHAHDSGVIHRDLKPANLLQTPDGRIKLTDFGIAKLFGATHRTADGSVVGTADYMSPEQSDGKSITQRTDLYSLGAVMFTLLSRRTPFSGGSLPQVIHKLKYEEAPSVRRFAPQTPAELDQIIAELLRKDPQQRVATALALANRLRAMQHALLAREMKEVPDHQAITQVGSSSSIPADTPTQDSQELHQPQTRLSPTVAERPDGKNREQFAWNDATVVTSANPPASAADADSISLSEPVVPRDRFTTLEEHERQLQASRELHHRTASSSSWQTAGIALAVVALIGLGVWGLWPPSADTLYARIEAVVQESGPADARRDMDQFLRRFPQDPRFNQVHGWRMDLESEWLASRLRLRKRKSEGHALEPYELRWLDAYYLRTKDPSAARREFERILAEHAGATNPTEELSKVLAASQHQLARLPGT